MRQSAFAAALAAAPLAAAPAALAEEPFTLRRTLGAPDWLQLAGETRARYETLDGQFRAGGAGGDQALVFRTLFLVEADAGRVAAGIELQDSRASLDDAGTPLSTSIVNPLDVLQAYVRLDLDGAAPGLPKARLKLGRQTLDVGSRRYIERVEMANVIFAYTGAYLAAENARGDELHLLHVSPVGRRPADREGLGDDDLSGDEEEWGRRLTGLHYRRKDIFGAAGRDIWGEAFAYRLDERDTASVASPDRDYLDLGLRLYRAPAPGRLDVDIEAIRRTGSRRATAAPTDLRDLDVEAWRLHAHAGVTLDHPWRPRLAVDYDYASGDQTPGDGRFDQYERLFGSRRTDLGNTGLHGPLTPANLDAPGARVEMAPHPRFDIRLAWKAAYLAEPHDAWVVARVQDPAGASGRFIGHAFELRTRTWLVEDSLKLEIGASALLLGRFAETAPNASRQGDATFAYVELLQRF